MAGCASPPNTDSAVVIFSLDTGSVGTYSDGSHYVVLDGETIWSDQEDRLRKYISYLLEYGGLKEVDSQEDAEYIVIVNYVDESQNEQVQQLALTAVSKKVFKTTGEVRPRWVAASRHYGPSPAPEEMLPMHALAIRDYVGGNPYMSQPSVGYKVDDPLIASLMKKVEGAETATDTAIDE